MARDFRPVRFHTLVQLHRDPGARTILSDHRPLPVLVAAVYPDLRPGNSGQAYIGKHHTRRLIRHDKGDPIGNGSCVNAFIVSPLGGNALQLAISNHRFRNGNGSSLWHLEGGGLPTHQYCGGIHRDTAYGDGKGIVLSRAGLHLGQRQGVFAPLIGEGECL